MHPPETTPQLSIAGAAWARTRDRWANYIAVAMQFIVLPLVIASIISAVSLLALPFVLNMFKDPNANSVTQIVAAVAALLLPVAAFLGALYRNLIGTVALIKVVIDTKKDRRASIAEAKALFNPYVNFISILSLISFGYLVYIPITLFGAIIFIQVITQFATFIFLTDDKRGARSIWTAVQVYKAHFLPVTGHAIVLQGISMLIGNIGTIVTALQGKTSMTNTITTFGSTQLFSLVALLLYQVFSISYMFEVYSRLKKPETVKTPILFILFSVLGWLILLGLMGWGIRFIMTHPIQLPMSK
ncbi:hypothetical protein HYS00_01375 [Candidatus Microgenomates bacterium]|nr:hypothetical protein [Candidatus Microgenomates bacterium]